MTILTTINATVTDPSRRHEFVLLFDIIDGNPNGDPDAGNLPRVDPETMQGLVTDVAVKRKVRDYVFQAKSASAGPEPGYDIYVKHRGILAREQERAYTALGAGPSLRTNDQARKWMCKAFYDIRMFGAVMTTGDSGQKDGRRTLQWNCGQVRGPVQLKFARSKDPITPLDIAITRVALTNPGDVERFQDTGDDQEEAISGQMGRKAIVCYALYEVHGFFTPKFATDTGVTADDMALLWQALYDMWDNDHSSARQEMSCRGLYVFSHESNLGNAPAHTLFERIVVEKKASVEAPRKFADYAVTVSGANLPAGVTLTRLVG